MELIHISDDAIKVMLSREDMEYYDIVFDTLDYSSFETRRALSRILAEAKRRVGFSAESERLYIQAFSDGDGGCELFVRRSEEDSQRLYVFENSQLLLFACARLYNCGFLGESCAYKDDGDRFYLSLRKESGGDTYPYLLELGRSVPWRQGFLSEHTEKICDNAVMRLATLK